MKIFIIVFILISSLLGSKLDEFIQDTSYNNDYYIALDIALKENKIIMLVLVADFCPWCKKFERKTLESKEVSKLVKQSFIPVIVDNYRGKHLYPKHLYTKRLPSVYFINPKTEHTLNKSTLYVKRNDFVISMEESIVLLKKDK